MVPGDPRRRAACPSTRFLAAYDALVEKARTNTLTADDLVGAQHHADQPRRARHGRLGAAADERPGHDRRDRLDRLPGRPRQHRRDDRRGEGHDDDLDLRPPHHPGRRVRALPGADRGVPAGRARLLRGACSPRSASSSARRRPLPAPRRGGRGGRGSGARRTAAARAPSEELLQAVQARQHARQPRAQPRPPRRAPGPARLRARGRPRPRPGGARADAGDPGEDPGEDLPDVRARGDARRRAAAPARDLLRHDRLRDRAHRLAPPARVAARAHRVRRVPPAADQRRAQRRCSSAWSRSTRSSASCTRPTSASTSSRSRAWT